MIYDVMIIGGGPAGYTAAIAAAKKDMNVVLIEGNKLGGVCLNEGCIPTKSLLYSSKIYKESLLSEKLGITASNVFFNFEQAVKRKNEMVTRLSKGLMLQLKHPKINIVKQFGSILPKSEDIFSVQLQDRSIVQGKQLLIATGTSESYPTIKGMDEARACGFAIGSSQLLDNTESINHVVIIGGGVVGIECASYLRNLGTEVTIIDQKLELLEGLDREAHKILLSSLRLKGINFKLGMQVASINVNQGITITNGELSEEIKCDKVLVAAGRKGNVNGIGLESLGIEVRDGYIVTNQYCETNIKDVYAIGDINGKYMLAHAAYKEAESVIECICKEKTEVDYKRSIPYVIYSNPEVAWIGMSEEDCKNNGIEYVSKALSMNYSSRFMIENERENGICKVLLSKGDHRVLGCHMVGNGVSEIIVSVGIIIEQQGTIESLKRVVFPHPSTSEIIHYIADTL